MSNSTDTVIGGRPSRVTNLGRVRKKKGWGYYNLMSVQFLDTGERLSMGGGEFARWSTKLDRIARTTTKTEDLLSGHGRGLRQPSTSGAAQ